MKRFLFILFLLFSAFEIAAESKIIYKNYHGLSELELYKTEKGYYIYAEELHEVDCHNIIYITGDKQKLSDIITYFLDHNGMKRNFINNLQELDNVKLISKETKFFDTTPTIRIYYNYHAE